MGSIVVAIIGGAVTLVGVVASNLRSRAVLEEKVDELSRRVGKHTCLVERTYRPTCVGCENLAAASSSI